MLQVAIDPGASDEAWDPDFAMQQVRSLRNRETDRKVLAALLVRASVGFRRLGKLELAEATAREARQVLEKEIPYAERWSHPEYADAIDCHVLALRALNRDAEALPPAREAEAIYAQFAVDGGVDLRKRRAMALGNLAHVLRRLGRLDEALEVSEHSVRLVRELMLRHPQIYRLELAALLNDLATHLGNCQRWNDAVTVLQEAVAVCRDIAKSNPEVENRFALAGSLRHLGQCLGRVGRHVEAMLSLEESVALLRRQSVQSPNESLHRLALSLLALGETKEELGELAASRSLTEEALRLLVEILPGGSSAAGVTAIIGMTDYLRQSNKLGLKVDRELWNAIARYQDLFA